MIHIHQVYEPRTKRLLTNRRITSLQAELLPKRNGSHWETELSVQCYSHYTYHQEYKPEPETDWQQIEDNRLYEKGERP